MGNKIMDPIVGKLMGLRYKSHPWHGVEIGKEAPEVLTCYIEMVP
ncbi:MAG: inorganic pyrophosphatase, partial [Bacteroidota bacterium]